MVNYKNSPSQETPLNENNLNLMQKIDVKSTTITKRNSYKQ